MIDHLGDKVEQDPLMYKLVLTNWHFDFKRVPNSQDYYFDINSHEFRYFQT